LALLEAVVFEAFQIVVAVAGFDAGGFLEVAAGVVVVG